MRLLIADEHPVMRQGLRALLAESDNIEIVGEADTVHALIQAAQSQRPDIVLLDLCARRHAVAEAVEAVRLSNPQIRFVVYTTFRGEDEVALAIRSQMRGYVLKTDPPAEILLALREVQRGGVWISPALAVELGNPPAPPALTDREREVLRAIASGKSNLEIAARLFISEGTVKFHVNNIFNKLGADDRTEAVILGLHRGLLRLIEK